MSPSVHHSVWPQHYWRTLLGGMITLRSVSAGHQASHSPFSKPCALPPVLESRSKTEISRRMLEFILLERHLSPHAVFTVYPHVFLPWCYVFLFLLRRSTQSLRLWGYYFPIRLYAVDSKIQTPEIENSPSWEMPPFRCTTTVRLLHPKLVV